MFKRTCLSNLDKKNKKRRLRKLSALGRHVLAEFYGCPEEILNDIQRIERTMVDAALEAGAEVREVAFHKFSPQGVSGVVVISESHLAIHTWPELGYAAVDVFTCGDTVDPWVSCNYLKEYFSADRMTAQEILRGIFDAEVSHKAANF
jgi:S-adenosylmethionine decarboxylase